MKKRFLVTVTKWLSVEFDTEKLDAEFWDDFNGLISDRGGEDYDYLAEHAAWNFAQGEEMFIEGIGNLREMGVVIRENDSEVEVDEKYL